MSSKRQNARLINGSPNPEYIDLLEEDRALAGQKFACVSFISPENIIEDKRQFFFNEFIKQWELSKSMDKFTQFIKFLSYKYKCSFEDMMKDLEEFVSTEKDALFATTLTDEYKTFMDKHEDRLQSLYDESVDFQTNTRGIKIRGSFSTQGEAELHAKSLRESDPSHDVFVGPVGLWMPFDPESYKTGKVEYLEEELNQLMQEKHKNEFKAKQHFENRVRTTKQKAFEDNLKKASESGNKLTQTMNDQGNLVSSRDDPTHEMFEHENISTKHDS